MNIAILGYGVEGESVYKYYRAKYPDAVITAYDNNEQPKNPLPANVKFVGGIKNFKGITADLAIKTPAIPPGEVQVSGEVTTVTREFMKQCPVPVIGVTGSKGKGTTASLIQSILEASGRKTWLIGNIGLSGLDILSQITPNDLVVYEMSSFQLWDLEVSPHVAVVLGIEPEHLDVHRDVEDYVGAKANIAKNQKTEDIVIYKAGNQYAEQISQLSAGAKLPYPETSSAHVAENKFFYGEQELCSIAALQLPGEHNRDNACAAIAAAWLWVKDGNDIERGLLAFKGLPHRLKYVKSVNDVAYYDDSIATTPGSAIAALAAFEQPKVLILGGSYKGATYEELAQKIITSDVRRVVIIGAEAPKIEAALKAAGIARYTNLGVSVTMADIVKSASTYAVPGDVVILSPACASFDMFTSYADRGEQFIQAVENLSLTES
jgi:UDP-N-acetylmuramoylalanine--D-glutamate ligase